MGRTIGFGGAQRQRIGTLPPRRIRQCGCPHRAGFGQNQLRLPSPDQIDVDFRQKLGIEQRAMLGAAGIVDRIARTEIIQTI